MAIKHYSVTVECDRCGATKRFMGKGDPPMFGFKSFVLRQAHSRYDLCPQCFAEFGEMAKQDTFSQITKYKAWLKEGKEE